MRTAFLYTLPLFTAVLQIQLASVRALLGLCTYIIWSLYITRFFFLFVLPARAYEAPHLLAASKKKNQISSVRVCVCVCVCVCVPDYPEFRCTRTHTHTHHAYTCLSLLSWQLVEAAFDAYTFLRNALIGP